MGKDEITSAPLSSRLSHNLEGKLSSLQEIKGRDEASKSTAIPARQPEKARSKG